MVPDSPAERSGQLFIGDHLLAVNNQDVSNIEHGDIVGLIKRSGLSIRLLVQQPQSMLPHYDDYSYRIMLSCYLILACFANCIWYSV